MSALSANLQYSVEATFEQMVHFPNEHRVNDFKKFLVHFFNEIMQMDVLFLNIKNFDRDDLNSLYVDSQQLSSAFDKLHQSYYDKHYLEDGELKSLLKSTEKQLHKLANISHKYYTKRLPIEKAPDYLKSGLVQYSQEVLNKKLS